MEHFPCESSLIVDVAYFTLALNVICMTFSPVYDHSL